MTELLFDAGVSPLLGDRRGAGVAAGVARRSPRARPLSLFARTGLIGVDFGTATTTLWVPHRGVVAREPSLVALTTDDGWPVAVGAEAERMLGRTPPGISVVRPVRRGMIADVEAASRLLRYLVAGAPGRRFTRPAMIVCVPPGQTEAERRATEEAAQRAGARPPVVLVESPTAAALGLGLPIHEARGSMVVVTGAGRTDVAVLSLGGVAAGESVPVGGSDLDDAIREWLRAEHGLDIGERTGEELKCRLGSARAAAVPGDGSPPPEREAEVSGRDVESGRPKTVRVREREVRAASNGPLRVIVEAVVAVLGRTPPDLAADVVRDGIALAGGGALLAGFDQLVADETDLPVVVRGDPLEAVARGVGHCTDHTGACAGLFVRP